MSFQDLTPQSSGNFWVVLEEKRREIIKEWIDSGRIEE